MALDLEEQEQVAELKVWWNQYGTLVVAVLVGCAIAIGGWQAWRWMQRSEAQEASVVYDTLTRATQGGDLKGVRDSAGALIEKYPRSLYASMGAMTAARFYFDRNDLKNAKTQLGWVAENARTDEFRDLARLRLAAVLLDEKAHDEALKLLATGHAPAFDAQYEALRGDVLVANAQPAEARTAYRTALEKADQARENAAFRESLRMRLEALGG